MDLQRSEQETHLNLTADNRQQWAVYSDDPVLIARLDKISEAVRITATGKHYLLAASQVKLRPLTRPLSDEERAIRAERLQKAR